MCRTYMTYTFARVYFVYMNISVKCVIYQNIKIVYLNVNL